MNVILAQPRGFCAGVRRAIETVELALKKFGSPIYVRHEIVHNKFVVDSLRKQGAVFVDEIDEIPDDAVVIFSAHGVSDMVENSAKNRGLNVIDATCPLVSKVHREAVKYEDEGYEIILIGHHGHPEVEGTSGRVKRKIHLVTNKEDAHNLQIKTAENMDLKVAYVTQTTLSIDDTRDIVEIIEKKYPQIAPGLATKDICYATQNRQNAVKEMSKVSDVVLVLGSKNSSNSNRLRDLAEENGINSYLIDRASEINEDWFRGVSNIGITAGASAPEVLVNEVVERLRSIYPNLSVSELNTVEENVSFALPRQVRK